MASCTALLLMLCVFVPCSSLSPAVFSQLFAHYAPRRTPKVAPAKNNDHYIPNPDQKPNTPAPSTYTPNVNPTSNTKSISNNPSSDPYWPPGPDIPPFYKDAPEEPIFDPYKDNPNLNSWYGSDDTFGGYQYHKPDQKPNKKPVSYTPAPSTYTPNVKINPTPKTKSSSNTPSSDPYWLPGPDIPPFYNDLPEEPIFDPFANNPNLNSWYGSDKKFGSPELPENYKPNSKPVTSTPVPPTYSYSQNNKPDPKPNDKPVSYTPAPSTYNPPVKPTAKTNSSSNNPSSEPYWPPGPDFPTFYYDPPEEPIFDPYDKNPNVNSWYGSGVHFENVIQSDNYNLGKSKIHQGKTVKDSRGKGDDNPRVPSNVNPPSSGFGSRPYTSTNTPSYNHPTPPEYSDHKPPAYVTPAPASYINPRGAEFSHGNTQSSDSKPSGYQNSIPPAGYVIPTPTGYVNPSQPSYSDNKPPGYLNPIPPAGYVIPTPTGYVNPSQPSYIDSRPPGYPNPVPPAGYVIPSLLNYVNPSPPRYGDYKPSGYANPLPAAGYIVPNSQNYVSYIPSGSENGKVPPSPRYANPQPAVHPSPAPSEYESGRPPAGYVTARPLDYVPPTSSNYTKTTPPGYNNAYPVVGYGESKQSGYVGSSASGNSNPPPTVAGYDNYKPSGNTNPPSSGYGTQGPSGYKKQEDVYKDNVENYDAFYLTADDPNYLFILEQYGLEEDPCKQRGIVFTFSSSCSTYFTCEHDYNGRFLGIRLHDCGDYFNYDIAQRKCVPDTYCISGCQNAAHVKPTSSAYKFLNGVDVQDCPRFLYFNFQSCTCDRLAIY